MDAMRIFIEPELIRYLADEYDKILHKVNINQEIQYMDTVRCWIESEMSSIEHMDTTILYMEKELIRYPSLWI